MVSRTTKKKAQGFPFGNVEISPLLGRGLSGVPAKTGKIQVCSKYGILYINRKDFLSRIRFYVFLVRNMKCDVIMVISIKIKNSNLFKIGHIIHQSKVFFTTNTILRVFGLKFDVLVTS